MNAPTPGLQRLFNRTKSVAKVEIRIQPGDEIQVPADVADGLLTALDSHFSPVADLDTDAAAESKAEAKATPKARKGR